MSRNIDTDADTDTDTDADTDADTDIDTNALYRSRTQLLYHYTHIGVYMSKVYDISY